MRVAAILFYIFLTAPVQAELRVLASDRSGIRGVFCVSVYGVRWLLPLRIEREQARQRIWLYIGKRRIRLHAPERKKPSLLKRFPWLKRELREWLRGLRFSVHGVIGLSDAAPTALLCGFFNALGGWNARFSAQISPDYQKTGYDITAHCITAFRLGKLLLTVAMLGAAQAISSISGGAKRGNHQRKADQFGHADGA